MALRQIIVPRRPLNDCKKVTVNCRADIKVTLGFQICLTKCNISDTTRLLKAPTPAAVSAAANGPVKEPKPLGVHGPKLLPRPVRLKPASGGNGGGPNNGGERTLASLIAYSGLVGTTALVLAYLSGIDVWSGFDWTSTDDLRLAIMASLPLQLLNTALLLPNFTSQRLPKLANLQVMDAKLRQEQQRRLESSSVSTQQQPHAQSQPLQQQTAGGDSTGSPASTSDSGYISSAERGNTVATPPAADFLGQAGAREAGTGEAGGPASTGPSGRQLAPPPGALPAAVWGSGSGSAPERKGGRSGGSSGMWQVDGGGVRSSLHLAQGYYIGSNPTARLSAALEAAVAAVDTAAGEMLYRGVALTWLARWLEDRMYELGLDEVISYQLPSKAAEVGGPRAADAVAALGVYGIAECAAVGGIVLFVVWSVLSASRRATQRLEALVDVVASAGGRQGHSSGDVKLKTAERKGAPRPGSSPRRVAQVVLQLNRSTLPVSGVEVASAVMRRAAAIQAARDAAQVLLLNGVFIATGGNLAASYTAALLNQLVISSMQRRGMRRMRERSAAMARELQAYNSEMRRILCKYKDKLPPEAASRLDAMKDQTSEEAGSNATSFISHRAPDSESTSATSSLSTTNNGATSNEHHSHAGSDRTPTTMAVSRSGTGTDSPRTARQDTSQAALPTSGLPVNTAAAVNSGGSMLQRTLSALDKLVPEPAKPPKAPSPITARQQQQHQQRPVT